jgi:hypothetical protein
MTIAILKIAIELFLNLLRVNHRSLDPRFLNPSQTHWELVDKHADKAGLNHQLPHPIIGSQSNDPSIELPADRPAPALEFIPGAEAENLARKNAHTPEKSPDHSKDDRGIFRWRGGDRPGSSDSKPQDPIEKQKQFRPLGPSQ